MHITTRWPHKKKVTGCGSCCYVLSSSTHRCLNVTRRHDVVLEVFSRPFLGRGHGKGGQGIPRKLFFTTFGVLPGGIITPRIRGGRGVETGG